MNNIRDDYVPTSPVLPIIILNIIKGTLVQHANERLSPDIINELSFNITEVLELLLNNNKNMKN
jgi:hypothetical protein